MGKLADEGRQIEIIAATTEARTFPIIPGAGRLAMKVTAFGTLGAGEYVKLQAVDKDGNPQDEKDTNDAVVQADENNGTFTITTAGRYLIDKSATALPVSVEIGHP